MAVRNVLESAQFVANSSTSVTINSEGVQYAADQLLPELTDTPSQGSHDPLEPPGLSDEEIVEWIFLLDTLNFCFWSDKTTLFTVNYKGGEWTGYRSLCAALCRAKVDYNMPIHKLWFYETITVATMRKIFKSDSSEELPLIKERMDNLHQAARIINEKYSGSVVAMVTSCEGSAQKLMNLLASEFESYRDISTYRGQQVSFLKRAQIFPADLWDRFSGSSYGQFSDIDSLTMFADYRVPQCLLFFGVLEYSDDLMSKLRSGTHLAAGSEEEAEIRACSIWSVEQIKTAISEKSPDSHVTSVEIDYFLWNYAKSHAHQMKAHPIHKTLTIFY